MDEINPYVAPQANVFDAVPSAAPLSWQQQLFSFEGRIRRGQYWGYLLVSLLAVVVTAGGLMTLISTLRSSAGQAVLEIILVGLYVPLLWIAAALQVKRWHDRGRSGWWMLLAAIPLANIWAAIEVGFLAGTPGHNAYGPPPA
jgi:uncharacterized membrane protein YhaH (DUF805 family)